MELTFIVIIGIWVLIGLKGIKGCKEERIHWEMIVFMCFVPFIPLVAKLCGLL